MKRWRAISRFSVFAAAVFLAGCAPQANVLPAVGGGDAALSFHVVAAVEVRAAGPRQKLRVQWKRAAGADGARDTVLFKDALGRTQARLRRAPGMATLEVKGEIYTGKSAGALAADLLGYELPLDSFGYWLLGRPDETAAADAVLRDAAGNIAELSQNGWRIAYRQRDEAGRPRRLRLHSAAAGAAPVKVDIIVKKWLPL